MSALIYLLDTFTRLYLLCFLLRIIFQVARVDFYHPLAQFIVQITNPLVVPARRLIPSLRRFDLPTLVVLVVLQLLTVILLTSLGGAPPAPGLWLWLTVYSLLTMTVWTLIVCVFIYVILSWIQPGYSPAAIFISRIVEPVLRPARRILPLISGIDLSPLIVTVLLFASLRLLRDLMALFVG